LNNNLTFYRVDTINKIPDQLAKKEKPLGEELALRVQENSPERANFSLYADYLLHNQSSHSPGHDQLSISLESPPVEEEVIDGAPFSPEEKSISEKHPSLIDSGRTDNKEVENSIVKLAHPLQASWLHKAFVCLQEEPSLLYGSLWSPVLIMITIDGYLHFWNMSASHNITNKKDGVNAAFQNFLQHHSKQCYEDDLVKPVDPTLRPIDSSMAHNKSTTTTKQLPVHKLADNPLFDEMIQQISWKDIESNNKEVTDK
jgi:hypothetical protein